MIPLLASLRSTKLLNERMKVNPATLTWWLCSYYSSSAAAKSATSSSSSSLSSSWILPNCAVDGREFQDLARSVGVCRIAFLRHGNTAPAENGVDFDRTLTALGREQSRRAGRSFGASTLFPFRTVLVSPAPRTVETAQLFLEEASASAVTSSEGASTDELSLVQGLYDGTMQPAGSVLFRKIGYAPLASYVYADDAADRKVAQRVLGEYSTLVAHEIHQCLRQLHVEDVQRNSTSNSTNGATILVVGHAIYLPAAALGISKLCGSSNQRVLLDTNTREASGYCIDLVRSSVELLER